MTLDVKKANPGLNTTEVVLGLEDGGAIVCNYENRHYKVVRVDSEGQQVNMLYTTDKSVTAFILLTPDELLILQLDGTIVRVQLSDGQIIKTFRIDVGFLDDGILDDRENLLLVDGNRMEVFNYCIMTKRKKIVIQRDEKRLNYPCSIHKAQFEEGVLYVVASQHCVNIYNSEWCFLRFLGSGHDGREASDLIYPNSATFTPWKTVFVVDRDNGAIKEFSLAGDFLGFIIQGIKQLQKLSLCGPHLWLSFREKLDVGSECNLKRYQINRV